MSFQCQKQHYFLESWTLILHFLTFLLHINLDPDPNPVTIRQKVTAPGVPVPVVQRCIFCYNILLFSLKNHLLVRCHSLVFIIFFSGLCQRAH
jgi:hypothetical protein